MTILHRLTAVADALPPDKRPVASISVNTFGKVVVRVQWVSITGAIRDVAERITRAEAADDAVLAAAIAKAGADARAEMK